MLGRLQNEIAPESFYFETKGELQNAKKRSEKRSEKCLKF